MIYKILILRKQKFDLIGVKYKIGINYHKNKKRGLKTILKGVKNGNDRNL